MDEIFIKETTGGEKKDGIISMLFDPIYRSMLGSNGFAVCDISLGAAKEIRITDSFSVPEIGRAHV